MIMKRFKLSQKAAGLLLALTLLAVASSCANREVVDNCLSGHIYGFWGGLWHGIIAPINLVIMLFKDNYTVYATNTNGVWYAFGFVLGSGGWGFFGGRGSRKKC